MLLVTEVLCQWKNEVLCLALQFGEFGGGEIIMCLLVLIKRLCKEFLSFKSLDV